MEQEAKSSPKPHGDRRLLTLGVAVRMLAFLYSIGHDAVAPVPYTDQDYFVFTDAAELMWKGKSPYERLGYRYPPLLAALLLPSVWWRPLGKLLFVAGDVVAGKAQLKLLGIRAQRYESGTKALAAALWLVNPIAVVVSTRGNCDSLVSALILAACVQAHVGRSGFAGILLGVAAHMRLFPVVLALPFAVSLKGWSSKLAFALACTFAFASLGSASYAAYGNEYLEHSILFHLRRWDTRHNLAPDFYGNYLKAFDATCGPNWASLMSVITKWAIALVLGLILPWTASLEMAVFAQAFALVAFNSYAAVQYLCWWLALAPPVSPEMAMAPKKLVGPAVAWCLAFLLWLWQAYWLEEAGRPNHHGVWAASESVFLASAWLLFQFLWPGH